MKQLDLFSSSSEENTEVSPALRSELGKGTRSNESDNNVDSGLGKQRLAHYRAKLAQLDETGYDEIAEIITSDTILGHNDLGHDMVIEYRLTKLRWSLPAISYYFRTRRKKNWRAK